MTDKPGQDGQIEYTRPDDVPPDLTPLDRALVAARNIRLWADWLIAGPSPAPERSDELKDASKDGS